MANLILGTSGADALLAGTPGPDAILGFDQNVTAAAGQLAALEASRVASGLSSPVFVTAPPLEPDRLLIVERAGRVVVLDLASGVIAPEPFLDLSGQVATAGEEGLLGLAFHPDFASNRRFYVYLSNPEGDSEVREYLALPGNSVLRADPGSARLVLRVDQPAGLSNHKAGWIGFGPDGQLHVALGDGGGGGDPLGNGQNPATLLGAMLRLDPGRDDFPEDPERNYGIPSDNPFAAAGTGAAPEIWAYGLRNPWRDSFDRATGELWIGDVGQGRWEEVNLGVAGANFGWNRFEGPDPFTPGATPEGLTAPLFAYGHELGSAVTGGYVYRGPEDVLQGAYLFADSGSGRVWALEHGASPVVTELTGKLIPDAGALNSPVSFGEDAEGRLYVVDFDGEVFRLTPRGTPGTPSDGADLLDGGGGDDRLFAGAGADRLIGGEGADTLFGMAGADTLEGGPGADRLWGGDGDDWLSGGPGADWIHGGTGADTAAFGGLRDDYAIAAEGGVLTISDRRPDGDGSDLVSAVEIFAFADRAVTLDALLLRDGASLFDAAFYLATNPDIAAAGANPAIHYATFGWREGRDPNALFDTGGYLAANPDVAAAGVDPLEHYATFGWREGRDPNALFDTDGYLAAYPDVAASGMNPLEHYIRFGWREGRDPGAGFGTTAYLSAYPDVMQAGMNPLEHYLRYGIDEGRQAFGDGF